jgi:hypothetical protein
VKAPELQPPPERPWQLERLVRKFDLRNRSLGRAGEEFVLEVEKKKLEKFKRPDLSKNKMSIATYVGEIAGRAVSWRPVSDQPGRGGESLSPSLFRAIADRSTDLPDGLFCNFAV